MVLKQTSLITFFLVLSCGSVKVDSLSEKCSVNMSEYYSVSKKIKKSAYKKESVSSADKTSMKQDLIRQISEKFSTVSRLNEQVIETGQTGTYSSFLNTEFVVSSIGSVNNAQFVYCKSNHKYYLYCLIPIKDFELDLYNEVSAKTRIFRQEIKLALSSLNSKNIVFGEKEMSRISDTNLFLSNAIDLVAVSNYISLEDRRRIIDDVAIAKAEYFKLENLSNFNFDSQINKLNNLLLRDEFEKIHLELKTLLIKQFNPSQRERLSVFKKGYQEKLGNVIQGLDVSIKKAIRNRDSSEQTEDLFSKYARTTFYKGQTLKLQEYKALLARRIGSGRTNLFFGVSAGSTFKQINNDEGQVSVSELNQELSFDQLLPAYEFGINHYFFNPKKRFGISATFRNYSDSFVDVGTDVSPDGIKDFSALQFGVILGQLELKYGLVNNNQELDGLSLSSLNWSILRTDKLMNKFTKSNFLKLSAFVDYLSDFKDRSYYQLGISLNYHLMFNRTSKY